MACTVSGITKTELAKRLGMTQPAFSQRFKTGKFSDEDFKNIASAIGASYFSGFIFPDGTKIEQLKKHYVKTQCFLYVLKYKKKLIKNNEIMLTYNEKVL